MAISDFIGIEYDHPRYNCWSLVHDVLQTVFKQITPQYHYDGELMNANEVFANKLTDWHEIDAPIGGSIVVFNIGGKPLHCGVMINPTQFLHCLKGRNSCIESLSSLQWSKRVHGFYEWQH